MHNVERTDLVVQSNGYDTSVVVFKPHKEQPENGWPVVICLHGVYSSKKGYIPQAEEMAKLGYIAACFDYPGRGDSAGDFTTLTLRDDEQSLADIVTYFAQRNDVNPSEVRIFGASAGCSNALHVAKEFAFADLILRAPTPLDSRYRELPLPKLLEIFESNELEKNPPTLSNETFVDAKAYAGKVFLIECGADEVIPASAIQLFHGAFSQADLTWLTLPGVTHAPAPEHRITILDEVLKRLS